jgi:hypothetical protein
MPVNPTKSRTVLVVHGVQVASDKKLNQHKQIDELLRSRLGNTALDFKAELYRYENLNDATLKKFKTLIDLIAKTKVGKVLAKTALDLVGDVVINLADGSTAAKIRAGLRERILETYDKGNPCYIVAHSLGSIYAFDVINELMKEDDFFLRDSRKTWPVQGLTTIGSPIGLGMFRSRGRRTIAQLGAGNKWFRWNNYWDRTDPVVSGNIFGKQLNGFDIAEKYRTDSPEQGWAIRDINVDTGKGWLLAHVAYWESPFVGDGLFSMVAN